MFKLEIETGNDAFQPDGKHEIARILRDVASRIEALYGRIGEGVCRDINGNEVGGFELIDD